MESRKLHFPKASQVKSNDQPDLGFPGLSNLPKATAHDLGLGRLFMDIILMPCVFVFICIGKEMYLPKGKSIPGYAIAISNSGDKNTHRKARKSLYLRLNAEKS